MRSDLVGSKYFILINSNTRTSDDTPEAIKRKRDFISGLRRIFLSKNILNFIDITNPEDFKIPIEDLLYKIRIEGQLETAPETGYLHCHIDLLVQHFSTIDIRGDRFGKFFKKIYNLNVFSPPPKLGSDMSLAHSRYLIKGKTVKLNISSLLRHENGPPENYYKDFTLS